MGERVITVVLRAWLLAMVSQFNRFSRPLVLSIFTPLLYLKISIEGAELLNFDQERYIAGETL